MIPISLNATDFLERLRGQRLVFVGDSLNRNMWESLVCILRQNVRNKKRVFEISGKREFKKKGVYAFRFEASFLFTDNLLSTENLVKVYAANRIYLVCFFRITIVRLILLLHRFSLENRVSKAKMVHLRH